MTTQQDDDSYSENEPRMQFAKRISKRSQTTSESDSAFQQQPQKPSPARRQNQLQATTPKQSAH